MTMESAIIEISLSDLSEKTDSTPIMTYSFYVSPEEIDISQPSRVAIYQSIDGTAFADNLGGGITTIQITGTTGFRKNQFRDANQTGFYGQAYLSYQLLTLLFEKYNNLCRSGNTATTVLVLTIATPDAPQFGQWQVTLQNLSISRSVRSPMIFRYKLTLLALGDNIFKLGQEKNKIYNKLINTKEALVGSEVSFPGVPETVRSVSTGAPSSSSNSSASVASEETIRLRLIEEQNNKLLNAQALTPFGSYFTHTVQKGENLISIARQYGSQSTYFWVSEVIRRANPAIQDWNFTIWPVIADPNNTNKKITTLIDEVLTIKIPKSISPPTTSYY